MWSSVEKLRHPYDFLGQVYEYELLGRQVGILVAVAIPALELMLGLALLSGLCVGGAMLGSGFLLLLFVIVQATVLWRGLAISCGCFGPGFEGVITYGTLIRTGALLAAAIAGYSGMVLVHGKAVRGDQECGT